MACTLRVFDLDLEVYMVKVSYHYKPRRMRRRAPRRCAAPLRLNHFISRTQVVHGGRLYCRQRGWQAGSIRGRTPKF